MHLPIFSKRHKRLAKKKAPELNLSIPTKRRILYAMQEVNFPTYDENSWGHSSQSDLITDIGGELIQEHGWEELKIYDNSKKEMVRTTIEDFMIGAAGHHVFDAVELYARRLGKEKHEFQERINQILTEAALPWVMAVDAIFRVDSTYMAEILGCAAGLLTSTGFDGAFEEFQKARAHLESSDTKESVHHANLALESTMKSVLGIDREKPGKLIRKMKDSGLIPAYYGEFLDNFEQILRSVNIARNEEKGAGHGQGPNVAQVPAPLAELVLNLCGALIVFLVKQAAESKRPPAKPQAVKPEDDIPF